jgi:hypothetical protein
MIPSFILIDGFLADPHEARRRALALAYEPRGEGANYPGRVSALPLPIGGLEDYVSRAVGRPVGPAPGTLHGHFRLTLAGDRGVSGVHVDPAFYSGILYLSLPAHCRGGTDFYRHRRTGLERVPTSVAELAPTGYDSADALIADVVNRDTGKPGKWERVFSAPMRFNRLILFSPWLFHNAGPGFGAAGEEGRLVQLLFFHALPAG